VSGTHGRQRSVPPRQSGASAEGSDGAPRGRDVVGSEEGRGGGHARGDKTALTCDTAMRVEEAALAETGGGTAERVETDAEGNAAHEAHVVKSDGSRVMVYVDEQFSVVSVDSNGQQ